MENLPVYLLGFFGVLFIISIIRQFILFNRKCPKCKEAYLQPNDYANGVHQKCDKCDYSEWI